jgi:hypothetical protein
MPFPATISFLESICSHQRGRSDFCRYATKRDKACAAYFMPLPTWQKDFISCL